MARTSTATVELPERAHLEGCPARPERIETFTAMRPVKDARPRPVQVTRCVDCGGQDVRPLGASSSVPPVDEGDDA